MTLQISQRVLDLGEKARQGLAEQFARIDAIAEENTARVLSAFQKHRVAEGYFAGTTGYGYDDLGRDQLDQIYADLFGTEAALVRIQFVNGTHAITCALFGALKAGDVLLSAVGAPYDTLMGAIGTADKGHGSLRDYGVEYRQVELKDDCPDLEGLARAAADPRVKAVLRSTRAPPAWWTTVTGSSWRPKSPPMWGRTWWWAPSSRTPAADWPPRGDMSPAAGTWWRGRPCG